jgi:hypothetical protein
MTVLKEKIDFINTIGRLPSNYRSFIQEVILKILRFQGAFGGDYYNNSILLASLALILIKFYKFVIDVLNANKNY